MLFPVISLAVLKNGNMLKLIEIKSEIMYFK